MDNIPPTQPLQKPLTLGDALDMIVHLVKSNTNPYAIILADENGKPFLGSALENTELRDSAGRPVKLISVLKLK